MSGLHKRDEHRDCTTPSPVVSRVLATARDPDGRALRRVFWLGTVEPPLQAAAAAAGWRVVQLDPATAATVLEQTDVALAIADFEDGSDARIAVLERLFDAHHEVQWLAITPKAALMTARLRNLVVASCFDFITRPLQGAHLWLSLGHAWGKARLLRDDHRGLADTVGTDDLGLVGSSDALHDVRRKIRKFAAVDMPVLVTGETGTGKDVVARALWSLSARGDGVLGAIDCGALPETLVQSELFGHERGAFTGAVARKIGRIEAAHGGIVFLDEIGDLPLDAQSNLLRFLQESTVQRVGGTTPVAVDARVIAATHVDLQRAVREGRFREDLYYRLHVLHVHLPPLRERAGDAELLAAYFLAEFRRTHRTRVRGFSAAARRALTAHPWPGNVRELVNRVRGAAVLADKPLIEPADLGLATAVASGALPSLEDARADAERETIRAGLHRTGFNISECARQLRISRMTLYRLCKKYRLKTGSVLGLGLTAIAQYREGLLAGTPLEAALDATARTVAVLIA